MVKKIGIVGCGGFGRTTLAKAIIDVLKDEPKIIVIDDSLPTPIENPPFEDRVSFDREELLSKTIFTPPLTRAERRKQERLNNKKPK